MSKMMVPAFAVYYMLPFPSFILYDFLLAFSSFLSMDEFFLECKHTPVQLVRVEKHKARPT